MKIFGLKPSRFKQWLAVVREESRTLSALGVVKMFTHMALVGTRFGQVSRARWRLRMRACRKCWIYDRSLRRCRFVPAGNKIGCGCWVVARAMVPDECWAAENNIQGVGWR